jgi:hypothetical protein
MSISVSDVKTAAIQELFRDGATANDDITPTMYCRAINLALDDIWAKVIENNLDLYRFTATPLALVAGTSEYALSTDTMRVTAMFIKDGTSPSYVYRVISPLGDSRDHYDYSSSQSMFPYYNIVGFSGMKWFESKQALDTNGNWVRSVTFTPNVTQSMSVVYDGVRLIKKVAVPVATDETTTYLDIPDNFLASIMYRVLKYAYIRDTAQWAEIDQEINRADATAFAVHRRGLNWQATLRVVRRD